MSYHYSLARYSTVLHLKPDRVVCALQHELLQRLGPVLEEAMHPFDCFAASSSDRRSPSGAGRTLPLSRRASAASHEDLHRLVDQVCAQNCLSLLHVETRRYLCAMCHRAASRMNLTCLIDQAHLKYAQL